MPLRPSALRTAVGAAVLSALLSSCGPADPSSPNAAPPASRLDSLPLSVQAPAERGTPPRLVQGQTLYVPAYSHIYIRDAQRTMNLATTLSVRNASPEARIVLSAIDYYDSGGRRVRSYLDTTRTLGALASTYAVVEQDDVRGGVGASFVVRWHAARPVHPPIVETVMITTEATQGISFRSTARTLYEDLGQP